MFSIPAETPNLDVAYKLVHTVGIPALVGVIVWLVRTWDGGQRQLKDISDNAKQACVTTATTLASVELLKSNHMTHLAEDIKTVGTVQNETVRVLSSIDKNIGILVDRGQRETIMETKVRHISPDEKA